jgi:hypothetical protein
VASKLVGRVCDVSPATGRRGNWPVRRHLVAAVVAAAAMLAVSACTTLDTGASESGTPSAASSPATASRTVPAATSSPAEPTFSAASITILSQKTVDGKIGKIVEMMVTAPPNTRFRMGTSEQSDPFLDCAWHVANHEGMLYRINCLGSGTGKKLQSIITHGDFDYGFEKPLK